MKNFIDDPGYEPVNPYRLDFNIPILRYIQVKKDKVFLDYFGRTWGYF